MPCASEFVHDEDLFCDPRPYAFHIAQDQHLLSTEVGHSAKAPVMRDSALADGSSRAEFAKERAGGHVRDCAKLGDEMRLVVVACCGRDRRPVRVSVLARGA